MAGNDALKRDVEASLQQHAAEMAKRFPGLEFEGSSEWLQFCISVKEHLNADTIDDATLEQDLAEIKRWNAEIGLDVATPIRKPVPPSTPPPLRASKPPQKAPPPAPRRVSQEAAAVQKHFAGLDPQVKNLLMKKVIGTDGVECTVAEAMMNGTISEADLKMINTAIKPGTGVDQNTLRVQFVEAIGPYLSERRLFDITDQLTKIESGRPDAFRGEATLARCFLAYEVNRHVNKEMQAGNCAADQVGMPAVFNIHMRNHFIPSIQNEGDRVTRYETMVRQMFGVGFPFRSKAASEDSQIMASNHSDQMVKLESVQNEVSPADTELSSQEPVGAADLRREVTANAEIKWMLDAVKHLSDNYNSPKGKHSKDIRNLNEEIQSIMNDSIPTTDKHQKLIELFDSVYSKQKTAHASKQGKQSKFGMFARGAKSQSLEEKLNSTKGSDFTRKIGLIVQAAHGKVPVGAVIIENKDSTFMKDAPKAQSSANSPVPPPSPRRHPSDSTG